MNLLPITDIAVTFIAIVALGMLCATIADRLRLQRVERRNAVDPFPLTHAEIEELLRTTDTTEELIHE